MCSLVSADGEDEVEHRRVGRKAPVILGDLRDSLCSSLPFREMTALHLVDDLSVSHALRKGSQRCERKARRAQNVRLPPPGIRRNGVRREERSGNS